MRIGNVEHDLFFRLIFLNFSGVFRTLSYIDNGALAETFLVFVIFL